ncbi:MAG: LCP family protein, partial [Actinobacteria bacterium]|nr:LCP family protein [Actinomycetota bacterium]
MGKHSQNKKISYWEARSRRKDLRNRGKVKKPRRSGSTKKRWFVLIFIIGFLLGGAIGVYYKPILKAGARFYLSFKQRQWQPKGEEKGKVEEALAQISPDPNQSINTLVIGSDAGSNKGETGWCRSDVMMLACLQERDKKAVVISIPRDTRVKLPGQGTEKINAAHSYGGPSAAINAVKELLGIDVHHYVSMNFEGFEKIINAIGGVPIHLNKPINDPHAGRLPAGDLNLDGEQALIIVRSRKLPGGDIDRIKSQQAFLKALFNKAETMRNVWKAKQLVDIVAATCQMDFTVAELETLTEELSGFPITDIQFVTVPGTPKNIGGASYYVADEEEVAKLAVEVKANTEVSAELMAEMQPTDSESRGRVEEVFGPNADVITVLSGGRSSTAAAPIVAEELRLFGHYKVFEGNAKRAHQNTTLYYRQEAKEACEGIKQSIPELADAQMVMDDTVATEYNSPVVLVLGA